MATKHASQSLSCALEEGSKINDIEGPEDIIGEEESDFLVSAGGDDDVLDVKTWEESTWSNGIAHDLVDAIIRDEHLKQKLIFTNTKTTKDGELYCKAIKLLKDRCHERGREFNSTIRQRRTKLERCISFNIVVCGLDSIVARRWINGMLFNENGDIVGGVVPLVDGGTEGFKGNSRVIIPGITACIECNLDLFPPQVAFPMCTIANTPRLPEHCIEYVRAIQWEQNQPFGKNIAIDGDDPEHIEWIYKQSVARANDYKIYGITYRLTQGVIKNIIPAVASTNAVVAAVCANEVFKLATSCYPLMNNYLMFNDAHGIYTYTFEAERKEDCPACSQAPLPVEVDGESVLQDFIDYLSENARTQMKAPGVTTIINGKNRTLYMQNIPSIEEATRRNLNVKLKDLGLQDGQEVIVSDVTSPKPTICKLKFIM